MIGGKKKKQWGNVNNAYAEWVMKGQKWIQEYSTKNEKEDMS